MNTATLDLLEIRPGDRVTFKAAVRDGCRKATRIVTSVPGAQPWPGHFTVKRYHGWSDFAVRPAEILEHHPREN